MTKMRIAWAALVVGMMAGTARAQNPQPGDFTIANFRFADGETLPALRLHYMTLGEPKRDASGHVNNAVLILHGTGGSGRQFLAPQFRDVLLRTGGLLDPAKYYIILPDDIGHGGSSKPSDGLRGQFPHYGYHDMVSAEYRLVTVCLHLDHLRLIVGTSIGCMHSWRWGDSGPDFIAALIPASCLPETIAGRNRILRKKLMDSITNDPE